ncbi:MAG TPA: leucyl aminopeptidase [Candidatus Limnocylindria bacterium]|nr:leucyl aminopeptidase [Candidatus Limnocylindria bacterium]
MQVQVKHGNVAARPVAAWVVGIVEDGGALRGAALAVDRATRGAITSVRRAGDFTGRFLETLVLYPRGLRTRRVILVGLGPRAELDLHRVRLAAAQAAHKARALGVATLATVIHGAGRGGLEPERAAQATVEGTVLGQYRFGAYRTRAPEAPLRRLEVIEHDASRARQVREAVARGAGWAEAACLARDLVNTPGQDLDPERLAAHAREIARGARLKVEVFGVPQMERLGMGAVLAVGRGSVHPPRFIVLDHRPAGHAREETVVVIGKGVTFDTGGISLKPKEGMQRMKYDMGGAAAVLGMFSALPSVAPPFRVVGLIPTVENMPGGRALKPGDIVRTLDGTTVEVTNTDAEGRLLLADALAYARRLSPTVVVDLATLTGAVTIALGHLAAGLFTEDEALARELSGAAAASGERLWPLPLWNEYAAEMRSDTGDLLNSAGREGGATLAAVFLKHFARGMRWAHLDIASTAWSPADRPHERRGGTGFGVRLLLEWLSLRAASRAAARAS